MSWLMPFLMSSLASSLVALLILGGFFGIEPRTRRGDAATSLNRGAFDRGSTLAIGAAFGLCIGLLLLTLALNAVPVGRLPLLLGAWLGWIGVGSMLFGLAVRLLAARTLGSFYTRTLVTTPGQKIVEHGLYRVIRHPGYLGDLILWFGGALATHNLVAILGIPLLMVAVYAYRIRREEFMLKTALGDAYVAYMARTWRLIPRVH